MSLSHIIKATCTVCSKVLKEKERYSFGGDLLISYECGHSQFAEVADKADDYNFTSLDGKNPRQYQIEGIKFAEQANFRCLIADEQGLGKTIQGLGCVRLHRELLTPFIGITKTTLTHQWYYEAVRWIADNGLTCQVIKSGKEMMIPGFDCYLLSYDMCKGENLKSFLPANYLKLAIIDECQAIKNHLSGRAKAVQDLVRDIPYVIALSGTPIKNHAGEYFTILNILQPTRFPEYARFLKEHTDHYWGGYGEKVGGLSNPEMFKSMTEDFIIRRTRAEAAPEIPKVNRQFYHVELDKKLHGAYRDGLRELEELMYSEDEDQLTSMIAIMTKLRKITGISKTYECVDYVTDYLLENENEKITIFAHHHTAVTMLETKLNAWMRDNGHENVLNLHSGLSPDQRAELVEKFKTSNARVMIASTLAAGEGLNLQFCHTAIMLERQWNPANEEQAEGRFARIGQTSLFIDIIYMIATGTIDDYFTQLVEQKRAIVASTLDGKDIQWDESSLLKDLASMLVTTGKEMWKM